ncbi:hypothetical protein GPECTOR_48g438 [Gonium pectorale]|uniref:Uncharacterized protein n=1 Tax=Gonium pectorale TaxID=33097 RepID=A0A150G817_GONPE|nr:hypothetical protein GPECTOR_48g438 [Gonium pectorale]|eukprot:KXZ46006.1 hypothetical protein GPECTOR_48g438 [Gonium pectorale]
MANNKMMHAGGRARRLLADLEPLITRQSPSIRQVTHARLQRCTTYALQAGFPRLQADLEPLTRQEKQLERLPEREAKRQRTAEGPGRSRGSGAGAVDGSLAAAMPQQGPSGRARSGGHDRFTRNGSRIDTIVRRRRSTTLHP